MKQTAKPNLFLRVVLSRWFIFAALTGLLGFVAYWRYPTYFTSPNFYAEDGNVFAQTILNKGFLQALLTPFNGYFIVGIYLLEGLAFVGNALFMSGTILDQPQALAVVSYLFWGAVCSLPVLLFWHDVKRKTWLVVICIALGLLQLPSFNYAILGTVGNYKFAFLFIAFLLLVKRHWLPDASKWTYWIDAALVICAFTNATVYLLLPFALLRYLPKRNKFTKAFFSALVRNKSFISLVVMGGLVALQVLFIVLHGGVDDLKGYLKEPFEFAKTIEIFIERTFLFPFVFAISKNLNDIEVVALFILLVGALWKIAQPKDRILLYFGLYAAFIGTALFVSQRTGVSQFYSHYQTSGTDQFFYPQNWIFLFTTLFIVARAALASPRRNMYFAGAGVLLIVPFAMLIHNDFGKNALSERTVGSFWYNTQKLCAQPHTGTLNIPIYPAGSGLSMPLAGANCTSKVSEYIPERIALPLKPFNNNYVVVNKGTLGQTFTADYNQLSGISVFFSTFGGGGPNTYKLSLLDASCHTLISSANFTADHIQDNSYYDVHVAPIAHSKGNKYCFTITPVSLQPGYPVIAEQLSAPDVYQKGDAIQNGKPLAQDTVFDVLYR